MGGEERRNRVVELIASSPVALSGSELAARLGVSRQVIVQDIALLRREGKDIVSTNRGYRLAAAATDGRARRTFKVRHTADELEQELNAIVDLGATVEDVFVHHRTYGRMSAELGLSSRRDVRRYLEELKSSQSSPLMGVTSGYHYHHVSADSEEVLDEVGQVLGQLGFLVERLSPEE